MSNTLLYKVYTVLCFCTCAKSACTPESVKDDLDRCLRYNRMLSYYMFPIVNATDYRNLCFNTTCLTYCMELVAEPCMSHDHTIHIGNGDALTAAYLGLCDQIESEVTDALTCGSTVSDQDVWTAIRTFQTSLENSYATSTENTTVICSEWLTLKATLGSLITGVCSGTSLTHWQNFLNTVSHKCDNSQPGTWYTSYRQTTNDRCSGSGRLFPNIYFILLYLTIILYSEMFIM
ncbi:uncharacterized protein LOC132735625 [Ruditapes philippinarum]|uniref:uncharacterized protein LOC132735625 n=1 Tax=Ruditapes philippinarum TaxID=129788 RepID=UPI00295C009F|nr:uncharacterized protein LOC132735625 [Ruditapes philippinarum]